MTLAQVIACSVALIVLGAIPVLLPATATAVSEDLDPDVKIHELEYGKQRKTTFAVQLPKGYSGRGKRHPVIVSLPMDASSRYRRPTPWERQAFEDGYIVVTPGIPGINLYHDGKDFLPVMFKWMKKNLSYDSKRVFIVGDRHGGVGAFYLALVEPKRFRGIIGMPGAYSDDSKNLKALKRLSVWLIAWDNDPSWVEASKKTIADLKKVGAKAELTLFENHKGRMTIDPERLFAWMKDQ